MNKPSNILVTPDPVAIRINPTGFHGYARDFMEAARSLPTNPRFSPLPYYLRCRAIELGLKAFLLVHHVPMKDLKNQRKLGHDLENIMTRAKSCGLENQIKVSVEEQCELLKANRYYASKGFEYFVSINAASGYPNLPDIIVLDTFASRLISSLEGICTNAS